MPFSLAELRHRAAAFARDHADYRDEKSQSQDFWRDFLDAFTPLGRRRARFEHRVKKPDGSQGYADVFWPGTLLVEQKSRGKNLADAYQQALDYLPGLPAAELPPVVLVSDFAHFQLYELDSGARHDFTLAELPERLHLFGFLTGYRPAGQQRPEDPANAQAAELMAQLHDALRLDGYGGHPLEVLLVRLLFCLFAEDTAIFDKDEFRAFLEEHTAADGHDLGAKLAELFAVLDTPAAERSRALAPHLASFPYVNGALFRETFRPATFAAETRQRLVRATYFDWSRISPAVFGSLFQSIADPRRRRTLGAHYTSEPNILKVLDPLLLDGLRQELAAAGQSRPALTRLQTRLAALRLLDPACGCGNFLVVAYRELRLLEHEILERLYAREVAQGRNVNLALYQLVGVGQVAGLEVEEFAARIAAVALWLVDHQLNLALSARFEQRYVRLPLTGGADIKIGNALLENWAELLNLRDFIASDEIQNQQLNNTREHANTRTREHANTRTREHANTRTREAYVVGNPPFVGSKLMSEQQRRDLLIVAGPQLKGAGVLDYVAAWYLKAARLVEEFSNVRVAFVSTNSTTQGEQVGILWSEMLRRGCHIQFAHRTFRWSNEARGNAAVYCVIIGFGAEWLAAPRLFDYATPTAAPQEVPARSINPYLIDGPEILLQKRSKPLNAGVPEMVFGSMPNDGGHLILSADEKDALLTAELGAARFVRPFVGAEEFINRKSRFCLWLAEVAPSELRALPQVLARVERVRQVRQASNRPTTQALAATPSLFGEIRQPKTAYLLVPGVSSENRRYIPIGFMPAEVVASNLVYVVPNATPYLFGILTSEMHMTWMRQVCGRLKSDFRYSASIVYNNYPFPPAPTEAQRQAVAAAAEAVLAARAQFPGEALAALYDPTTMPAALARAHHALDRAVDRLYRPQPFATELARLEFLFGLYQQLSAPLLGAGKPRRRP